MDGLMFDTETIYSLVHGNMSSKRGKVFNNTIKAGLTGKRAHEVMSLLNTYWEKDEKIEDLFIEQDEALTKSYKESTGKMEGLDELIEFLNKHNIRKCIGTSSRRFLVDILLNKFGMSDKFEFIVSGDMVEKGKPDPEIYQRCLSLLKLKGEECLVLEDSLNGVKAGIAAGCKTCAIPTEHTQHEDFSKTDLIATSLADKKIKDYILRSK